MRLSLAFSIGSLLCMPSLLTAQENKVDYRPTFSACLKTKYEMDFSDYSSRFNVRNARVGVKGKVASWVSYRFQMDLTDEGQFRILDADVSLTPIDGLKLSFGQTKLPFFEDDITSPTELPLANRPLLAKFLGGSSRDIGLNIGYTLQNTPIPVSFEAGIFNGSGINNPEWNKNFLFAARVRVGRSETWLASVKTQQGYYADGRRVNTWDVEGRWTISRLELQAEGLYRWVERSQIHYKEYGALAQALYTIPLKSEKITAIKPIVRYDVMGLDQALLDSPIQRATIGVNLCLSLKPVKAEIRLNYEKYFGASEAVPHFYGSNVRGAHDKITLELWVNI